MQARRNEFTFWQISGAWEVCHQGEPIATIVTMREANGRPIRRTTARGHPVSFSFYPTAPPPGSSPFLSLIVFGFVASSRSLIYRLANRAN
jgi:hypothetical protein